jgi:protein gp37
MKQAGRRLKNTEKYKGLTQPSKTGPVWNGNVRLWERALKDVNTKHPTVWFVNSMGDLFHENIPFADIKRVWVCMTANPQHQFQILTKRADRLAELANQLPWPDHIWVGVSVENQAVVGRIDYLRSVPAHIRFLSLEPLLGPLPSLNLAGIHWVIVGGESGKDHRPIKADWVRDIRNQCQGRGVPFFFKQWGGRTAKAGGKELDGREWQEFPIDMSNYSA